MGRAAAGSIIVARMSDESGSIAYDAWQGAGHAASRERTAAGFTIVEIAIVLGLIGIFGALGSASYGGVIGRTRATGDANDLVNSMALARSEATKRGRRVTMLPTGGDWAAGWTIFVDTDGNRRLDAGEPLILSHPALHRTTRVITDTTPGYVAFAASGLPQQYSGGFLAATIGLCDSGTARSIVLAKTGRPRIVAASC